MNVFFAATALLPHLTPMPQLATGDRETIFNAYGRLGAPTLSEEEAAMRMYYAREYTDYAEGPPPVVWPFWKHFDSYRRQVSRVVKPQSWYGIVSLSLTGDRALAKVIVHSEYSHFDYGKMRRYTGSVLRDDLWRKRQGRWQIVETRHRDFLAMNADPPIFPNEVSATERRRVP